MRLNICEKKACVERKIKLRERYCYSSMLFIQDVCSDNPVFTCITTAEYQTMHKMI